MLISVMFGRVRAAVWLCGCVACGGGRVCVQSEFSIRASAFTLFGRLTKFGVGVSAENFLDQLHTNIPIFLVHLNDEIQDVRKVLGSTVILSGAHLGRIR